MAASMRIDVPTMKSAQRISPRAGIVYFGFGIIRCSRTQTKLLPIFKNSWALIFQNLESRARRTLSKVPHLRSSPSGRGEERSARLDVQNSLYVINKITRPPVTMKAPPKIILSSGICLKNTNAIACDTTKKIEM